MGLKLKIFCGYFVLVILSVLLIFLFYNEQAKKRIFRKSEQELANMHRLVEKVYISLLDLASQAEVVSVWDENDFTLYQEKRKKTCSVLIDLKQNVRTAEQQMRLDSLCLLLEKKEHLLITIADIYNKLAEIDETVKGKIPAIVTQVQQSSRQLENIPPANVTEEKPKKRKNFWNIFRKKERKSAYRKAREQKTAESNAQPVSEHATTLILGSLRREVTEKQKIQRDRLLIQMDSLYENNLLLNRKLYELIADFEKETNMRLSVRYKTVVAEQEEAYSTIAKLAFFVFFLAVILYMIVHKDINRRNRYKNELEASDRKNRELLHSRKNMMLSIAHDLRSPLATIQGYAELLPGEEDKSRQEEYAKNIVRSSRYMLGLINTLIDFYLLDTGRREANDTLFHLEAFFKETENNYKSSANRKQLLLTTNFSRLNVVVNADRSQLQQIVNNLLSNAVKFTRQGEIHLQAEYQDGELQFSVQDTGVGISQEEEERIFNAFERLDNARNVPGFGLGLAIVAKLVAGMKGNITVKSEPGKGSTFTVFLPLAQANESELIARERTATNYYLENVNVLVIDDDRIQLDLTKEMLSRNGVRCNCCESSRELITCLRTQKYDLLLSDIQMPETDGYDILELLRSSNIEAAKIIPIVAVTACEEEEKKYLACGFAGCLHKPFSMDELMEAVANCIKDYPRPLPPADFTALLEGEKDRKEMLTMFVHDTKKALADLRKAIRKKDYKEISHIIHKGVPLWETIHVRIPVSELKRLASLPPKTWNDEQLVLVQKLADAVEQAVKTAIRLREELE